VNKKKQKNFIMLGGGAEGSGGAQHRWNSPGGHGLRPRRRPRPSINKSFWYRFFQKAATFFALKLDP
jgi:hypothetical protein